MAGITMYKFGMVCWCDKPMTEEDRDNNFICGDRPVIVIQDIPISLKKATVMPLGGTCLMNMHSSSGIHLEEYQSSFMKPYDIGPVSIKYLRPLGMLSDDDVIKVKEVLAQYFGINSSHDVAPERAYFADTPLTMSLHRSAPFNWSGLTHKATFRLKQGSEEIDRPLGVKTEIKDSRQNNTEVIKNNGSIDTDNPAGSY